MGILQTNQEKHVKAQHETFSWRVLNNKLTKQEIRNLRTDQAAVNANEKVY